MKRGMAWVVFLAGILALGWWVWHWLTPDPERAIRQRLAELAQAAGVPAKEGPLAGVVNAQNLAAFFSPNVQITVDVPGHSQVTLTGRDELLAAATQARGVLSGLKVEFLDIRVAVAADQHAATAHLTGRGRIPGDGNYYVQELRLSLKRIDGKWTVTKVEGVKTLSRGESGRPGTNPGGRGAEPVPEGGPVVCFGARSVV
jgi:hypothetical protein